MSGYAVLKGASYTLAITPDMVLHNGTTQTTEMVVNPDSEYLKELPKHLRSFEDAVNYIPNQVYIGNTTYETLRTVEMPWYDKKFEGATREGKYGEIMPQDEFIGLMQICDVFELVQLEKGFAADVRAKLAAHKLIGEEKAALLDKNENDLAAIENLVNVEHAEGVTVSIHIRNVEGDSCGVEAIELISVIVQVELYEELSRVRGVSLDIGVAIALELESVHCGANLRKGFIRVTAASYVSVVARLNAGNVGILCGE